MTPPRKFSALPPRGWRGASPKAVSGRTSYLRVRLEFLPYPRLIPTLFNGCGYGPPAPFTASSAWTRIGHPVSGLRAPTLRPVQTSRFPCGSARVALSLAGARSSPDRSTKSTRSRMARSRSLWTRGFRFSFTPLPGFFSPFLHSTVLYRSLGSIQPCGVVPAPSARVSRVPAYSGSRCAALHFGYGAFTLCGRLSQSRSPVQRGRACGPNPAVHALRFGLFRFRSPLLPESMFLSFPPATWMFRFAGFPSARYGLARGCTGLPRAGFPIQTPADRRACAPPRSFSQLVASFVGSQCQGIRPVPFLLGRSLLPVSRKGMLSALLRNSPAKYINMMRN